ncbi:MAG: carboxypeptidase-like regulatory domain-containing protein [Bacteroidetes bacterium]|nr:MAG: carboxypeptidase-like regulatory domain-containing protein [Bacteroidota bacterium]
MKVLTTLFILLISFSFTCSLKAQVFEEPQSDELIQFSGVILTTDSLQAISLAHIIVINSMRGTVSDFSGYFSFVAKKKDTVQFSAIGFKTVHFIIPDSVTNNRYSLIQVMSTDTIWLTETIIYPWPTKAEFKEAFLTLEIPDDDLEVARKNLSSEQLWIKAQNLPASGSVNFKYLMHQQVEKLYYNGQTQPISILNPFAWAKFIKSWRDGDFKRKPVDFHPPEEELP